MSEQNIPVERQPIDQTLGLGEFLTQMQYFAGVSQKHVADELGVSQQSVSRWMNGTSTPPYDSANTFRIKTIFGLNDEETRNLILNNRPWERSSSHSAAWSDRTRRRLGIESPTTEAQADRSYASQMLSAFVVRAETGPPLNEVEADLIRFLVQHSLEQLVTVSSAEGGSNV